MPNRSHWISFSVSLGAALFALYALEWLFTVASPAWIDKLGTTLRRGPSVVAETYRLRARGVDAYPYLQPDTFTDSGSTGLRLSSSDTVVPLSGIPNALTILCNESGTTIGYRSDSLGFRNPDGVWNDRRAIALVGDSFTHGFCRSEPETVAGVLRQRGASVTNTGLTGMGPLAELGVLAEYVKVQRPRQVFWLFYEGNDLIDLVSERNTTLVRYLDSSFSQQLRGRSKDVELSQRKYAHAMMARYKPPGIAARLRDFLLLRKLRTATGLYRGVQQPARRDESREIALLRDVLARAQHEVAGWGGKLYLVYLPERRRFNPRTRAVVGENHDPRGVERDVMQIADTLRIPVLNVASAFAKQQNPLSMWNARRYHYNARGYRVVADMIEETLRLRTK